MDSFIPESVYKRLNTDFADIFGAAPNKEFTASSSNSERKKPESGRPVLYSGTNGNGHERK